MKYKGINDAGRRTGSSTIINPSTMPDVQHTWVDVNFVIFPCTRECRFSRVEMSKIWRQGAVLTTGYIWCSARVEEHSRCPGCYNFAVPRFLSFGLRPYLVLLAKACRGTVLLLFRVGMIYHVRAKGDVSSWRVFIVPYTNIIHVNDRWFISSTGMAQHRCGQRYVRALLLCICVIVCVVHISNARCGRCSFSAAGGICLLQYIHY